MARTEHLRGHRVKLQRKPAVKHEQDADSILPDNPEEAIGHAARSLTSAERNNGRIETKGLAFIFAMKAFHNMLYWRHFRFLEDLNPLLAIFG
ncbi:unnamed protein product [Dibothriocephalus latus]|uniref:Reverse transcriptase RNase H-like domain-containing protein n=1 Tax=Dibothriocephalus latus TaxID=60516 RepID=A0A3P6PF08_DIBLA|nr:unnamed protein product [Dibothriocephalus latus]